MTLNLYFSDSTLELVFVVSLVFRVDLTEFLRFQPCGTLFCLEVALFKKALRSTNKRMKLVVVDSQYSCQGQREQASNSGVRAVILYPANQMRKQRGLLRVDRYFRIHGPISEKRFFRLRSSIERVNSRLKEQLCARLNVLPILA